jgi:general secretion pathway protein D
MKTLFTSNGQKFFLSIVTAALLSTSTYADCTYELFNIASVKGTTVGEFVDQISDECGISLIVTDVEAEKILKKQMNKTYLKNLTINEVLDLIVKENNLQYTLQNNILKVSYLTTKTYQIDYIIADRKGEGSTNIRLSSNTGTNAGSSAASSGASGSGASGSGASSESGTNITSKDEVKFWTDLSAEIKSVLSRPEDDYRQAQQTASSIATDSNSTSNDFHNIYINKAAGLITVTGTGKQLKRLDDYITNLQKRMQAQVMIDVKMYSVVFQDGSTKGVDWAQLYALQNVDLGFNSYKTKNVTTFTGAAAAAGGSASNIISPITAITGIADSTMSIFQVGAKASINEVVKFLETQGDVYAISNPKILTLNNQPALITAGTELFYKTLSTSTLAGGTTGEQATSEIVSSVFSGVLLDITPEIADDGSITLRINPSISDVASQLETDNSARTMPPDLSRRQLSSVVTVKDGSRIILGGLITTKNDVTSSQVPLLGSIPVVGWLFKVEGVTKKTEEIVIIIEPHIIKKDGGNVGLKDLGYSHVQTAMEKEKIIQTIKAANDREPLPEMRKDLNDAKADLASIEEKNK